MEYALCTHNVKAKDCELNTVIYCDECKLKYLITDRVKRWYFGKNRATPENNQILLELIKKRYSEKDYAEDREPIWVCFSDSPICKRNDAFIIKNIINF